MDNFLKVSEISQILEISKVTIYKKIKDKQFKSKYVKKINGITLISIAGIDELNRTQLNNQDDYKRERSLIDTEWLKIENEKLHTENANLTKLLDQQQKLSLLLQNQNNDLVKQLTTVKSQLKITDGEYSDNSVSEHFKPPVNQVKTKKHWFEFWKDKEK
ncbi:hypothetical protein [Fructilactobacillus frigidiflavus]|uniref:hypothetical protein n=1 Tax=Fructilactobacillus frigidiflavus TaxID=3242688 RepID=UPI0037569F39